MSEKGVFLLLRGLLLYYMGEVASENSEVLFLLQKIESIIDTRLIGEVEPLDDEIELIGEYQKRKSESTLSVHEILNTP